MVLTAHAAPITPEAAKGVIKASGATISSERAASANAYVISAMWADQNLNFSVRLGDCSGTGSCSWAMTFATYELPASDWESVLQKVNSYNDSYPFGRAFVVAGANDKPKAIGIDYAVNIADEASFDSKDLTKFRNIATNFIEHWTEES